MTTTANISSRAAEIRAMLDKQFATKTGTNDVEPTRELFIPTARTLDEFIMPFGDDPNELLKYRYLCRGGALLMVGPTGHGKSSLAMQFMIKWGAGQGVFGFEPTRPLKSLLIQAENDDGDLAEMKTGVFNGLNMSQEDQAKACQQIHVSQESAHTGMVLCHKVLEPLLAKIKPDLLWIDPALAYLGGDMNNQKEVGSFLRNHLGPLLIKHNCGAVMDCN